MDNPFLDNPYGLVPTRGLTPPAIPQYSVAPPLGGLTPPAIPQYSVAPPLGGVANRPAPRMPTSPAMPRAAMGGSMGGAMPGFGLGIPREAPQGMERNVRGAMGAASQGLQRAADVVGRGSRSNPVARSVQDLLARASQVSRDGSTANMPIIGRDVSPDDVTKWIRFRESSNNYQAKNPSSTASGAYQYINSTWNNYGGYPEARMAPPEVQDRKFQEDLARRIDRFDGDVFKAIAYHYLPALANRPEAWQERVQLGKSNVDPVEQYIRGVIKNTPLEESFDVYLQQFQ